MFRTLLSLAMGASCTGVIELQIWIESPVLALCQRSEGDG